MRRLMTVCAAATLAAASLLALTGGTAQGGARSFGHNLSVRKVVNGTATGAFVVHVECQFFNDGAPREWDLPFLANGAPDPAAPAAVTDDWNINDGHWIKSENELADEECTVSETQNGGATSTTYTCEYIPALEFLPSEEPTAAAVAALYGRLTPGCSEPSGSTGPTIGFQLPETCFNGNTAAVPQQLEPPLICRDQALVTVINNFAVAGAAITFTG
jgi:hypothetical protein